MAETKVDWSECPIVEVDPKRVGGRPVLKGTRMPADDILANYEYGAPIEEIAGQLQKRARVHSLQIAASVSAAKPGDYAFIEKPVPPKPRR